MPVAVEGVGRLTEQSETSTPVAPAYQSRESACGCAKEELRRRNLSSATVGGWQEMPKPAARKGS